MFRVSSIQAILVFVTSLIIVKAARCQLKIAVKRVLITSLVSSNEGRRARGACLSCPCRPAGMERHAERVAVTAWSQAPGAWPGPGLCFTWRWPSWPRSRRRSKASGLRSIRPCGAMCRPSGLS